MINQNSNFPILCNKLKNKSSCEDAIKKKWTEAFEKSKESSEDSDQNYKDWLTDEEAYFLYTLSEDTPMSFEEFMNTDQKGYWTSP